MTRIRLRDDHWSSRELALSEICRELREYVEDCCDGVDLDRGLDLLQSRPAPRSFRAAEVLVDRVNRAIDSGTNGLVVDRL